MKPVRSRYGPPPLNYGGMLPQFWVPERWRGFGAADVAAPATPPTAEAVVLDVVAAFQTGGLRDGLALASQQGAAYEAGARFYVAVAGFTEPELAQRVAVLAARVARSRAAPDSPLAITKRFGDVRLAIVRKARTLNHTPPQAVIDRPVLALHALPKWLSYVGVVVAGVTIFAAARPSPRGGQ